MGEKEVGSRSGSASHGTFRLGSSQIMKERTITQFSKLLQSALLIDEGTIATLISGRYVE